MFELFFKKKSKDPDFSVSKKSLSIHQYFLIITRYSLPLLYCVLFIGFTLYVKHESNLINQSSRISIAREADILTEINDLEIKIDKLKDDSQQILTLKKELSHIEQSMVTEQSLSGLAKSSELQKIVLQLQKSSNKSAKNNSHRTAWQLKNRQSPQSSNLPFQILSIDSVSGQDFISVQYQNDIKPLRLNDQIAGWKLVRLDALQGRAVWENSQRHRVTIVLRSIHYA